MPAALITRSALAERWSKSSRTLSRYAHERREGFPVAVRVGGRWHYRTVDVEAFEAALVSGALREAA